MNDKKLNVRRLSGSLGAEITGIDLADVTAADIDWIKATLCEHMVLFFPNQNLDAEHHVALGRSFGQLEGHPHLKNPVNGFPEIFELTASAGGVADEWHTDITFQEQPALMSILKMVKCPEVGGDTMWTNLCHAFDELSEPLQKMCEGLTALHDAQPHNRPDQMAIHPVVRVHPVTGKKALYVNEHFTRRVVETNATESEMLLSYLTSWVKNPRFTVRYQWSEGTIAMWDNRCTQHFVLNDFEGERVIQRVTVTGDQPEGVNPPAWKPWTRDGRLSATSRHDRQLYMYMKSRAKAKMAD
ncbi:MAG: taurine dioxygenase [Candidatus Azotimanducaceae bacterium]|jgi:taurine dioxygenase